MRFRVSRSEDFSSGSPCRASSSSHRHRASISIAAWCPKTAACACSSVPTARCEARSRYPAPITYLHVRLKDGERWSCEPAPGHDVAWLAVASGALRVDDVELSREMAVFEEGRRRIDVVAHGETELPRRR